MNTETMLKGFLEHAPKTAPMNSDIRGWWTPDGYYVCNGCAARIMARGCSLPSGSEIVWKDRPEPYGECCCCE